MANYNVTITDGTGSQQMKAGNYSVTVNAPGFDETSLDPKSFTATAAEQSQAFTVTASGTLTLVFNETGAEGGTPITAGSVQLTDETGVETYGSPVTIQNDGTAVFENVPFGDTAAPFALYFNQTASDDTHNPYVGVINVSMDADEKTVYVINAVQATQTFTLTDATYGLPVPTATLSFTE